MKTLFLLSLLIITPAFAVDGGGPGVGSGDPAATHCLQLGGALERVRNEQGESENCVIDEWKLFRAMDRLHLVKPIRCNPGMPCMPNPAAMNCVDINGSLRIRNTPRGEEGFCVVNDWKLWRVFHP